MSTPGAQQILSVENLRAYFHTPRGVVRAIDGVDLSLTEGRALGLVGESGCGKSVFARTVMGLLPSYAKFGDDSHIKYRGTDLLALPDKARRALCGPEISMIFQDPMTSLNPVMRISDQVTEGMRFHLGYTKSAARAKALELLTEVGIPQPQQRLDQYPHQLSGGMRQRVAIAIALACEPKLLIADEPTTALDVTVQAGILDLLQREQRARGMTVILITHDLGVVAGRCDDVAVMYAGKIVECADTPSLFGQTRMPYTQALLDSIPRLEQPPHQRLNSIGGRPPQLINPPPGCRFSPRCKYSESRCAQEEPSLLADSNTGRSHHYACWSPLAVSPGPEVKA
ncbi:MAG: ABC transporter ATP-binding protein [Chromatiales bacterium]|jgi:peptide/nickel transport system ATP-binding protein|nr:ABC transporter ATP-binding protein [Chromatiales bacterium]